MKIHRVLSLVAAFAALTISSPVPAQEAADPFPPASAESVGLPRAALDDLSATARATVERDDVVGVEIMVIKDRRTVLHEAYGFKDRESKTPMTPGAMFCIRSMTKPLVGAAAQILIDEGRLSLDDPASKFLPSFDHDNAKAITVRHLLTHTSGLPLSLMVSRPLTEYHTIFDVADEAGKHGPEFEPGTAFNYSDAGTDTLTAIVERVSGLTAEEFVRSRVLGPLGMSDTVLHLTREDPHIPRVASAYAGSAGNWIRFWHEGEDTVFPLFLGSQSAYSTCADYARFLAMFMDGGMAGGKQLLSPDAVKRVLTPRNDLGYPTRLSGERVYYGQLMMVYCPPELFGEGEGKWEFSKPGWALAHGGSDGTFAWAWPDRDLIVLFFTQSRGNTTFLEFEGAINRMLNPGAAPERAAAPAGDVAGLYWNQERGFLFSITQQRDKVTLESPGRFAVAIRPGDEPDRWVIDLAPDKSIRFERDGSEPQGPPIGLTTGFDDTPVRYERLKPAADLPTVDGLVERVLEAHGMAKLGEVLPLKRTGVLDRSAGQKGTGLTSLIAAPDRFRTDIELPGSPVTVLVDGARAWRLMSGKGEELPGPAAEQALLEGLPVVFGDWRKYYKELAVIARAKRDDREVFLLRAVPSQTRAVILLVDAETGRVAGMDGIADVPGIGVAGVRARYEDFRAVGPLTLPFKSRTNFSHPLLGETTVTIETVEPNAEVAADTFTPPAAK